MNHNEESTRKANAPTALTDEELEDVNGGLSFGILGNVQSLVARFGFGKAEEANDELAALEQLTMDQLRAIKWGDPRYNAAQEIIRKRLHIAGNSVSL